MQHGTEGVYANLSETGLGGGIDEYNMNVQITAVIYDKRDQLYHLSKMDIE